MLFRIIALPLGIYHRGGRGNLYRTFLEKFNETRTIRIVGKNVDDLDLEKLGELIRQATEKSSKFNFRGLFKGLKKSQPNSKK